MWSETAIQVKMHWARASSCIVTCPNYTPLRWYECDLFAVTNAEFFTEYEIKMSKADFHADMKKKAKHNRLERGDIRGPSRFFYVAPEGVIPVSEVPAYAGLIVCGKRMEFYQVKGARRLHKQRIDRDEITRCIESMRWRFWRLMSRQMRNERRI